MDDKTFAQSGKVLTSAFQKKVYARVKQSQKKGVTDQQIQDHTGRGHGSTSSALSTLHKNGYIVRLKEKRNGFTVYVLPEFANGREILPPMTNKGLVSVGVDHRQCEATIEALRQRIVTLEQGQPAVTYTAVPGTSSL